MKALLKILIPTVTLCSFADANAYLSVGGGSMEIQVSELPIYASNQSDSSCVRTLNLSLGWEMNDSIAVEISGSTSDTAQIHTDPLTAYALPNVRYVSPTTAYDAKFQSLALRFRYKKSFSDRISGLAYAGAALISADLNAKDGYYKYDYSSSDYTIQAALGFEYKLEDQNAISLLLEHNDKIEINRQVEVRGTAIQLSYVKRF